MIFGLDSFWIKPKSGSIFSRCLCLELSCESLRVDAELQRIKDANPLETVILESGIQPGPLFTHGWKALCCFHSEKTPSLCVYTEEQRFKCYGCGKSGDVFSWVMEKQGMTFGQAKRFLAERAKIKLESRLPNPKAERKIQVPVPDKERLHRIVESATTELQNDSELQDVYLHKKRGISLEIAKRYLLGFKRVLEYRAVDKDGKPYTARVENCWVIPVATPDGKYCAIKLHREDPPEGQTKSYWMPIGIWPKNKPQHGYTGLWPNPEWQDNSPEIFLEGGMLKSFASLSMGFQSCAVTQSESSLCPELMDRLARRIVIVVRDPDKAGEMFAEKAKELLTGRAFKLKVINPSEQIDLKTGGIRNDQK